MSNWFYVSLVLWFMGYVVIAADHGDKWSWVDFIVMLAWPLLMILAAVSGTIQGVFGRRG